MKNQQTRFIPTYVGHTLFRRSMTSWASVHPHIRGAYSPVIDTIRSFFGSSPHTWGILLPVHDAPEGGRFIPTYVGHTLAALRSAVTNSVHPHIRGAYIGHHRENQHLLGSSPHTWGIRRPGSTFVRSLRFIPTYVGHTGRRRCCCSRWPVHPHIRGAYKRT